ncbi:hypothetical protein [Faecalibacterium prausnitzii]|uniref:hypothetical protein n=1 Tax=Faecalibacterium prausnitzii TaxID=853 RepID=UPI003977B7C9
MDPSPTTSLRTAAGACSAECRVWRTRWAASKHGITLKCCAAAATRPRCRRLPRRAPPCRP